MMYTSAQRKWLEYEMKQWGSFGYLDYIKNQVDNAAKTKLLKKVLEYYNYKGADKEFPLLAILQHYGAPTPLLDWSYNYNVALFMATVNGKTAEDKNRTSLKNYFSIYRINKLDHQSINELYGFLDIAKRKGLPKILDFAAESNYLSLMSDANGFVRMVFYISDFIQSLSDGKLRRIQSRRKPLTSIYNQNIIPQEGLFIFNPDGEKPLEDMISKENTTNSFNCYNIHKDLSEYLRRKTNYKERINKSYIYPDLYKVASQVHNDTLNGLV